MTLTCGEVIINPWWAHLSHDDLRPGLTLGSFCVRGSVMVHRGNPMVRDWVGGSRTRIQRAVYASSDVCWIDGKPVDWQADPRSRFAPSVDHVIPRALGGDPFDLANCRLAHLGCNAARGKRLAKRKTSASRSW